MSVAAYQQIANETTTDKEMSRRVIKSILSYINDLTLPSFVENRKTESLLNAHTLTSGALLSLSHSTESSSTTFLFNLFDYVQEELIKEIRRQGNGNLFEVDIMLTELLKMIDAS